MTPELISTLATALGAVATIFAGMHLMLRRVERRKDARFDAVDARFGRVDARFDRADARFDKVDARFDKVDEQIRLLRDDVVELKVAVARLEGAGPTTLLRTRG